MAAAERTRRGSDEHEAKRIGHRPRQTLIDELATRARHVPPDRRGSDIRRGGAIEQRLLNGERRAEVVRGGRVIERIQSKVGGGELPLRKKRTEDKDRVLPRCQDSATSTFGK